MAQWQNIYVNKWERFVEPLLYSTMGVLNSHMDSMRERITDSIVRKWEKKSTKLWWRHNNNNKKESTNLKELVCDKCVLCMGVDAHMSQPHKYHGKQALHSHPQPLCLSLFYWSPSFSSTALALFHLYLHHFSCAVFKWKINENIVKTVWTKVAKVPTEVYSNIQLAHTGHEPKKSTLECPSIEAIY